MKLIVANLKMNQLGSDIKNYKEKLDMMVTNNKVVICPTYVFIPFFKSDKYSLGAQNVYYEEKGSYTGEVSPLQLKSLGVTYTIVGHSERRIYFDEVSEIINKRIKVLLKNNMIPILCVGESKIERLENNTFEVINKQLTEALIGIEDVSNIVIAYEPMWSIGTGLIPKNTEINDVMMYIKDFFRVKHNAEIKVLYGGSVNENDILTIEEVNSVDGYLIGSASVNIDQFLTIIDRVK